MREWRFIAPLVPLFGAGVSVGLSRLRGISFGFFQRWGHLAAGATVLVLLAATWVQTRARSLDLKRSPEFPITWTVPAHEGARRAISGIGMRHPEVAIADIGGGGLAWRDADVIDDAGLADYALAHHANNMPAQEDYLISQAPLLVDAHGPSGYVRSLPRFIQGYVPANDLSPEVRSWGGLMVLRGATAQEDPRCPGGKQEVLGLDVGTLSARVESLAQGDPVTAKRLWRCALGYWPDQKLPGSSWRERLANEAADRGAALGTERRFREAIDQYELACALSARNAHLRILTESMRDQLFPRKEPR
jgi:hypothetical protein